MKKFLLYLLLVNFTASAQISPSNITIARDSFGIPHVFAKTDPEVAYGIAWAHAEDDFETLQLVVLSGKAKLGTGIGKKGAEGDYVINLLRIRKTVDEQWNTLSPDFLALIKGYVAGLNAYAKAHPSAIKYKQAFPFDEKEYMTAVVFSIGLFCGIDQALPQILGGKVETIPGFNPQGSNAFAMNSVKTTTGESFLAINAHQPQEGPVAFYEAHLQSEQGWNMLGGLFPGGCLIFHGTNENLGWAHTVNYQDKIDVFQLEMNPANKNQYKFDGQWMNLEQDKAKLKVKGIPITIGKKIYWSKYGATLKTDKGVFALRVPATMDIKALEEWYRMNKAKNFTEFYKAVSITSLPMFNIMYADRYDTIFYISNGKMPRRNPDTKYNWKSTVPGNTSATLWTEFKPISELPQYINPSSGYLFNTNHSPFLATDTRNNLDRKKFDITDGYETYHNNRSQRVTELINSNKVDYTTFKKIKFDLQLPNELKYTYGIDSMLNLSVNDYPVLKDVITNFQGWDRKAITTSKGAAIFLLVYDYVAKKLGGTPARQLTKSESVETYQYVYDYMMQHFGKTDLVLGDIQKLVRGDDVRPAWGLPDVLAATYTAPYKDGMRKVNSGDAYICFVRYPKDGSLPIIESVNTFGASMHPDSPHYKDQMTMFQNQQTKPMTLDKQQVLKNAKSVYHPQ
ncbi:MAG: penicillin acylase family protein [Chitinophagaceae bacterium]|mgnify:CR=1 FL=1|nr:penicillin acylase family protein [Chitinophagaceae bacterium]MBP6232581.1 penicillin acylase family protein [Chitinophagaceae bacterium]HQW44606.1 penicillin acylase family protein [Chitinophagaceae bacterium]